MDFVTVQRNNYGFHSCKKRYFKLCRGTGPLALSCDMLNKDWQQRRTLGPGVPIGHCWLRSYIHLQDKGEDILTSTATGGQTYSICNFSLLGFCLNQTYFGDSGANTVQRWGHIEKLYRLVRSKRKWIMTIHTNSGRKKQLTGWQCVFTSPLVVCPIMLQQRWTKSRV